MTISIGTDKHLIKYPHIDRNMRGYSEIDLDDGYMDVFTMEIHQAVTCGLDIFPHVYYI